MEKQMTSNLKEISIDIKGEQKKIVPGTNFIAEKVARDVKAKIFLRILAVVIIITSLAGIVFFTLSYYKLNFTPAAILRRSVVNFINRRNVDYKGTIKITFSYKDKQEKLSINDIEIYSLLKRSGADNHEVEITGNHNWENSPQKGSFNLVWNVSGKKIFTLDGNYQNSHLSYKVDPYVYSDLVDENIKNKYSEIDLSDLFSTIASKEDRDLISGINTEDLIFTVSDVFQDDIIDGSKNYHYKVKMSGKNEIEKILERLNYGDLDVWIDKKSKEIKKIKGGVAIENIGVEGNDMDVQFDLKF